MAQSHACCTIPPVVHEGYEGKGKYITVADTKTYSTGASGAKTAILLVYDIFGFFPQTIQGADIIAHGDKERPYQVFIPDFFDGKPLPVEYYPPDTEEKKKFVGNFFSTYGAPTTAITRIPKILKQLQSDNPSIKQWGITGLCWGGKVVNLVSQENSLFKAAASVHPAMVDPNDAPGVTIPIAMLPSKDEDKDAVEKWEKGLKVKHIVEWFPDQHHGFMGARGDLKDPKVKSEYERGYKLLLDWFHDNIPA